MNGQELPEDFVNREQEGSSAIGTTDDSITNISPSLEGLGSDREVLKGGSTTREVDESSAISSLEVEERGDIAGDVRIENTENSLLEHVTFSPHFIDEYDNGYGHRRISVIEEEDIVDENLEEEDDETETEAETETETEAQTQTQIVPQRLISPRQNPLFSRSPSLIPDYQSTPADFESTRTTAYTTHGNNVSLVNETDPLLVRRHVMHLRSQPKARIFFSKPFFPPLIFDNHVSEARDLCAAERNFLAGLKMGIALGVAGAVLYMDLRLPTVDEPPAVDPDPQVYMMQPKIDQKWATPLAILFFMLAILTIIASFINYVHTVASLAMQEAKVTTHKAFGILLFGTAGIILATNIAVLVKADRR